MLELLQFRHSPYNEEVRWALDIKRVPHRRRSLYTRHRRARSDFDGPNAGAGR